MTYFLNEPRSGSQVERKEAKNETEERMSKKSDIKREGKVKRLAEPQTCKCVIEKVTLMSGFSPAQCNWRKKQKPTNEQKPQKN